MIVYLSSTSVSEGMQAQAVEKSGEISVLLAFQAKNTHRPAPESD